MDFNLTRNIYTEIFHEHNRIGLEEPKIKGFFVALMVKPDLNLRMDDAKFNSGETNTVLGKSHGDAYAEDVWQAKIFRGLQNDYIRYNLTHSKSSDDDKNNYTNYFSPIIANKVESISYPDIGSNSEETITTLDKNVFKLPIYETGSSGMSFSMRLRENESLDALRMISVWHKYMHAVTKGNIKPKTEYIDYNIIDYKASLYVLHLKPDFRTITMWSKFTGIYPTSVPLSAFSEEISQLQDVTIDVEFSYDKFEWLNEDLLKEINLLTKGATINRSSLKGSLNNIYEDTLTDLIYKVNGTPYYQIDFNGLQQAANGITFNKQAASLFGLAPGKGGRQHFPAILNSEMVDASTNFSISRHDTKGFPIKNDEKVATQTRQRG